MSPVRKWWWDALLRRRRHLAFFATRWPRLAPKAVRARAVAHYLVGNPHAVLALAAAVVAVRSWPVLGVLVAWFVFIEMVLKAVLYWPPLIVRFGRYASVIQLVSAWREAWSLRSLFPALWAEVAHRTSAIQAEVGSSSGESRPPARLRPIGDHPKLSWFPELTWPTISFWCSPPPGRDFAAWEEIISPLVASFPRVEALVLEYGQAGSSIGRITFVFMDVLSGAPASAELDDFGPVLAGGLDGAAPGLPEPDPVADVARKALSNRPSVNPLEAIEVPQ